jgi:trehalose 6-phosphate phosphatase
VPSLRADTHGGFDQAVADCAQTLRHRPSALLTDLDGTISPIARDPDAAIVLPECREALSALAGTLHLVAVVTGRPADVARQLVSLDHVAYFGMHGMERWTPTGVVRLPEAARFVDVVRSLAPQVRSQLDSPGIVVEEKGPGLAVHYRQSPDPETAHEQALSVLRPLAARENLVIFEGRMVVELRPPAPLGKGWLVKELARERGLSALVYLGDDRTDVEAMEAVEAWRKTAPNRYGVNVAVSSVEMPPSLASAADYVLDGVPAVEFLLRALARGLG